MIVVLVLLLLLILFLLFYLPRQREVARLASCRRNLQQIGQAVALYDNMSRHLPACRLGEPGPLGVLLSDLNVSDFRALDPRQRPKDSARSALVERPVAGFTCPSDPHARPAIHPTPVSYRATTGDAADGRNGAFAPDRLTSLAAIEASDGKSYTALFSERLAGDGRTGRRTLENYARVVGPVAAPGCPGAPESAWRGDAGASWASTDWRSTLYTHALAPNAAVSCIADDGRTALMGASSGHLDGVNVLFADLSVRTFTPRVDARVWREWARFEPVTDVRDTTRP